MDNIQISRKLFSFSLLTIDRLNSPYPTDLFIEWKLAQIGIPLNVDRLAFLQASNGTELQLVKGVGKALPLAGFPVLIPIHIWRKIKQNKEICIYDPTPDIGWDAFFAYTYRGELIVIAIDDTTCKREFSDSEQALLQDATKWFAEALILKRKLEVKPRTRDLLTGLPLYKQAINMLTGLINTIRTETIESGTLALISIKNFDSCCETFGYQYGNRVLKAFTNLLDKEFLTARYGLSSFLIVTTHSFEKVSSYIDSLRKKFCRMNLSYQHGETPYFSSLATSAICVRQSAVDNLSDFDIANRLFVYVNEQLK
ncbi:diguanylate cyclase domain-containing protein [Patescibacteria group bacterium]